MTKQEMIDRLVLNHQNFTSYISLLDDQAFVFSLNNEKWSAGQQADHIYLSLAPLKLVLGFPKWITKSIFRKANRPSKSYEELVRKYFQKLEGGGRASGRFVPGRVEPDQKIAITNKIESSISKLCGSLN